MIKTGLYKLSQLFKKDMTLLRKELKNVSITLYAQILDVPDADNLAERILLLGLQQNLWVHGGSTNPPI